MSKEQVETEQVTKKPSVSPLRDALDKFSKDKAAEKKPSEEIETKQKEEEPCEGCSEEEKAKLEAAKLTKAPRSRLRFVNEKGEDVPFVYKVDGKDIEVIDPEELAKKASFGHKGYDRFGELNRREEELEKAEPILKSIVQALSDGRLSINQAPSKPSGEEKVEEGEEDVLLDPEIARERSARKILEKELKELKDDHEKLKKIQLSGMFEKAKSEIDKEMEKLTPKYQLATRSKRNIDAVWKLLAQTDEKGKPSFSVEEAMKTVHEEEIEEFRGYLKEHPEEQDEKGIIAKYLEEKDKKEKAPVSPPSEIPTVVEASPEKKKYKSLHESLSAASVWLNKRHEAGTKV